MKKYLKENKNRILIALFLLLIEAGLLFWAGEITHWWNLVLLPLTVLGCLILFPKNRIIRVITGTLLLAALPVVLGRRLELMVLPDFTNLYPQAMKWNLAIMYGFEGVLVLLTQSTKAAVLLAGISLNVLYTINYYVYTFRGSSFKLNDITAAGTAARVLGNYSLQPSPALVECWLLLFVFLVWASHTGWKREKIKSVLLVFVRYFVTVSIAVVVTFYGGNQLINTNLLENHQFWAGKGMYSQYMYYWDGYLVASCLNIKLSRVEKPQGYSAGRVEEILQPYEKSKDHEKIGDDLIEDFNDSDRMYDEELPHVILIMNESFADMQVLGDLQMNQDNIPFFRSLQDNTIKGYLYSSIMGGGTANSEFEVLTGCSCAFLPASYYPYQQCLASREVPSMVSMMKKQGYTTYAMHPATEKNWERGSTYKRLGFDHTYWEQDFDGGERIHFGTSDAETYRKVIELYEKRQRNEKMFLFDVTIQNHGAYYESDVEQIIQATNVDSVELNNYLSLVYQSDLALQELISYFEQQDEKVVVCMFGDHQPAFANEDFYREIRGDAMTDEEQIWNKYKVPFVIWANYELEESQGHEMSMNFFGEFLMHALGFETSPFFDYLKDLRKGSPVLTSNGYLGEDGQVKEWSENNTEFLDYRILQYYYLFSTSKAFKGFE